VLDAVLDTSAVLRLRDELLTLRAKAQSARTPTHATGTRTDWVCYLNEHVAMQKELPAL
jgi:hypothetical protein